MWETGEEKGRGKRIGKNHLEIDNNLDRRDVKTTTSQICAKQEINFSLKIKWYKLVWVKRGGRKKWERKRRKGKRKEKEKDSKQLGKIE